MSDSVREIKLGLDTKWGFSKLLQAREYRKAAKSAYYSIKVVPPCNSSHTSHCSYYSHRYRQTGAEVTPISLLHNPIHCRYPVGCTLTFPEFSSLTTVILFVNEKRCQTMTM